MSSSPNLTAVPVTCAHQRKSAWVHQFQLQSDSSASELSRSGDSSVYTALLVTEPGDGAPVHDLVKTQL